jgi:hypothetical protein
MKQSYIASAMIHAVSALRSMQGLFGNKQAEFKKIHEYQHPHAPSGESTGCAASKRAAKKTRNIRARAKK